MDPMSIMLLAAQATGIGMQYQAKRRGMKTLNQQLSLGNRYIEMGGALERSELSMRMQEEFLASEEQALFNSESLRETLASQNVLFAARGQKGGVGTARAITNKSIQNYQADEAARKLALNFSQFNIENRKRMSLVNQSSAKMNLMFGINAQKDTLRNQFNQSVLDTVGAQITSSAGFGGKGKSTNYGTNPRRASAMKSLTRVGR